MSSPAPSQRRNNFNAVRLLAALSVVWSHSFLIAEGTQSREWFVRLTGNQCALGLVGVFVFFAISGYLITESWCRRPVLGRFAARRFLRIYPALVLNTAICALLLGPIVTKLSLPQYFTGPDFRGYIVKMATLYPGPLNLPGVAFSHNQVGWHINGAMWTLRSEAMMYAMVALLGMARILRLSTSLVLLGLGIAAIYFEKHLALLGPFNNWAWLLGFYASGMVVYFLRDRLVFDWRGAVLALAALAFFVWIGRFIMLFPLVGGYLVIWFARRYDPWLDYSRFCGDLSYGLYIYGWPSEEFVMWLSGGHAAWWQVFFGSLAIALLLSWLSWHAVEKWALRRARRPAPPRLAAAAPAVD